MKIDRSIDVAALKIWICKVTTAVKYSKCSGVKSTAFPSEMYWI